MPKKTDWHYVPEPLKGHEMYDLKYVQGLLRRAGLQPRDYKHLPIKQQYELAGVPYN